ncbi:MAG: hypothetical protein HKP41_15065 [Desulfobacterales bacterium]|nr:hypothetical protein [Desulfobacterales bacterium]
MIIFITLIATEIFAENVVPGPQSSKEGILDGMVFVGHVGPKGGAANDVDEVYFQNGQFHSKSCNKYGFGSAPYSVSQDDNGIIFKAVTHSTKHGQIVWEGKVMGEEMEATSIWTKKRWYWFDAHEEFWLNGSLKKD